MHLSVIKEKDHSGTKVKFFYYLEIALLPCNICTHIMYIHTLFIHLINFKIQNCALRNSLKRIHLPDWLSYIVKHTQQRTVFTYLNTKVCRIYTSIKNYIWSFLFLSVSAMLEGNANRKSDIMYERVGNKDTK